jgi:hypothetical protein
LSRVIFLLAFSIFLNYADRSTLSIAATLFKKDLGLSALQFVILLSSFFWISSSSGLFRSPSRAYSYALRAGLAIRRRFGRGLATSTRLNDSGVGADVLNRPF